MFFPKRHSKDDVARQSIATCEADDDLFTRLLLVGREELNQYRELSGQKFQGAGIANDASQCQW